MFNVTAALVVGIGDVGRHAIEQIQQMVCDRVPSRVMPSIFRTVHIEAGAADVERVISDAYLMGLSPGTESIPAGSEWKVDRTRIETFIIAALDSASYTSAFAAGNATRARASASISGTRTAIFMIAKHRLTLEAEGVIRTAAALDSQVDDGPFTRYFFVDEVNESREMIQAGGDVIESVAAFVALALISPMASEISALLPQAGFGQTLRPYASFGYCRLRKKTDRLVHLLATEHARAIRDRLFRAEEASHSPLPEPWPRWLVAAARDRIENERNTARDPHVPLDNRECHRAVGDLLRQLVKAANWNLTRCKSWLETILENGLIALEQMNLAARTVRSEMADLKIKILLGVPPPASQDTVNALPSTRLLGTFGLCICLATAGAVGSAAYFNPDAQVPLMILAALIAIGALWAWATQRSGGTIVIPGPRLPGWEEQLRAKVREYAQLTGAARDGLTYYESIDRAWAGIDMLEASALTPAHRLTPHSFDIELLDPATAREWISGRIEGDEPFVAFLASQDAEQLALDFCRAPDVEPIDNLLPFCLRWLQDQLPSKVADIVDARRRSGRTFGLEVAPPAIDPALSARNRAVIALCPVGELESVREFFAAAGITNGLRLCEVPYIDDPEIISLSWNFKLTHVMPLVQDVAATANCDEPCST